MDKTNSDENLNLVPEAGFSDASIWRDFAIESGFKRVKSVSVSVCPDCGSPGRSGWGQFVHYSTLCQLLECTGCALVWANRRIDGETLKAHFETAYKDEQYFLQQRRDIFDHIVSVIVAESRDRARVLDIGGATGELMAMVTRRRPDIQAVVFDVSEVAVSTARERHRLTAFSGDVSSLSSFSDSFDVIVLSDVLYYEPNLAALFDAIRSSLSKDGVVIIRLPNKAGLIRVSQLLNSLRPLASRKRQAVVRYFNPEHLYIIRRKYLSRRLAAMGLANIQFAPSPLLSTALPDVVRQLAFSASNALCRISAGRLIATPGMLVVARRGGAGL